MINKESAKLDQPNYPRHQEVLWVVPNDGRRHVDVLLLTEAKKRVTPLLAENEEVVSSVGPTSIIEQFKTKVGDRVVDPVAENVTVYSHLFTIDLMKPEIAPEA